MRKAAPEKRTPLIGNAFTPGRTPRYLNLMPPRNSLWIILFLFPCLLPAADPNATEMRDRSRSVILNRAVPLMEDALRAAERPEDEARNIALLLEEQRRTLLLFLNFSALTGDELQAKLQQVIDVTLSRTSPAQATP
jgi:hypothetical protein